MRTLCALIACLAVTGGVVTAQSNRVNPAPRSQALPPDPPPPLYLPRSVHERPTRLSQPPTEEQIERLLIAMRSEMAVQAEGTRQAEPVDEFKPISELPPEDRLPSAPMLVGAYAFVMLAIFAYLVSLSRRLNAVGRDLAKFDSQSKRP